jgi:acyl-CoA dehydrogenase
MSDELDLLEETLRAIFDRHCTAGCRTEAREAVPVRLWQVLDEAGVTDLASPDSGGNLPELVAVARAVGRAAAPVPLIEAAGLGSWLLASAAVPALPGIVSCAVAHSDDDLRLVRDRDGWSAEGTLHRVPWGASADQIVAHVTTDDGPVVVLLPACDAANRGRNLADEPRDTVRYDRARLAEGRVGPTRIGRDEVVARGALLRAAAMAGAMEQVLELTLAHAGSREQFGRPISSFQAVQHHLVAIAEETACVDMAVRAATVAGPGQAWLAVAAAKVVAGNAAAQVTRRAHQVFGAVGVTQEHSLHWYTTRLWAWQDEFGAERSWAATLGRGVLQAGPEELWPSISACPDDGRVPVAAADR